MSLFFGLLTVVRRHSILTLLVTVVADSRKGDYETLVFPPSIFRVLGS